MQGLAEETNTEIQKVNKMLGKNLETHFETAGMSLNHLQIFKRCYKQCLSLSDLLSYLLKATTTQPTLTV